MPLHRLPYVSYCFLPQPRLELARTYRRLFVAEPFEHALTAATNQVAHDESFLCRSAGRPDSAEKGSLRRPTTDHMNVVPDEAGRRVEKGARKLPRRRCEDQRDELSLDRTL